MSRFCRFCGHGFEWAATLARVLPLLGRSPELVLVEERARAAPDGVEQPRDDLVAGPALEPEHRGRGRAGGAALRAAGSIAIATGGWRAAVHPPSIPVAAG